jgi:hypothetical protein
MHGPCLSGFVPKARIGAGASPPAPMRPSSMRGDKSRRRGMIRKLSDGTYRLYSRKKTSSTGKRRNLGTFDSRAAAEKHERAVQYFKQH